MRKPKVKSIYIAVIIVILILSGVFILGSGNFGANKISEGISGYQTVLSKTGKDTMTVSWSDSREYEGIVKCNGKEINAEVTEVKEGEYYRYSAEISDIEDCKSYEYCVGDGVNMSSQGSFNMEEEETSFLYVGDIQYQLRDRDYEIWGQNIKQAYEDNDDVDLALLGGDMVEHGPDIKDWEALLTNGEPVFSRIPMMTTVGNHETSITPGTYVKMMALPQNSPLPEEFYSFDYGDCHFVSLNSCLFMKERKSQETYISDVKAINDWLKKDLKNSKKTWKIVYMHHPMYPVTEDDEIYQELRNNWEDIFTDSNVDIVFCGHQHTYMRTRPIKGITYLMANSGEKKSYYIDEGTKIPEYVDYMFEESSNYVRTDISGTSLKIKAYSSDGKQIDEYEIKKADK